MNIKRAKEEIEHTVKAYLAKDTMGAVSYTHLADRSSAGGQVGSKGFPVGLAAVELFHHPGMDLSLIHISGGIVGIDADGEGIHAAELLEQYGFALHHRQTGLGADVTQAQHGGAVGDNGHHVALEGVLINLSLIHI